MTFLINRADGAAIGDNHRSALVDASALAGNIDYVIWDDEGVTSVYYSDLPSSRFFNPMPFQPLLNQWLNALSGTLTLIQAKKAKTDFLKAIFTYRRQLPVTVATSVGTHQWDATDSSAINGGTDWIGPFNTLVTTINALITSAGNVRSVAQTGFNAFAATISATPPYASDPPLVPPTLGTVTFPNALTALTPPTLQLVPVGGTSALTVTANDIQLITAAIAAQRADVTTKLNTKQAAVNALSSFSAVLAYDATTGW